MPLLLMFPSNSMHHANSTPGTSSPHSLSPSVHHPTARAEWLIASAIVVATLILVLLVIGPPHVM
jgi:lambda repressor-like predicted transcriptional regulator